MASVLIHSLCLSIFFLPWNRWLIENDLLRAAVCVVLATTLDGAEMIGFSGPLMWYLFLAGILLLFRPESDRAADPARALDAVGGDGGYRYECRAHGDVDAAGDLAGHQTARLPTGNGSDLLFVLAVQLFALVFSPRTDHPAQPLAGVLILALRWNTATVVSWDYAGVVTPLAGKSTAFLISKLPSIGPPLFVVIGLAILVTWLLTVRRSHQRARLAVGLYLALGRLASALYTRNLIGLSLSLNGNAPFTPARYVVLAGALLVYMACLAPSDVAAARSTPPGGVPGVGFWLRASTTTSISSPTADFSWKAAAAKIIAWRAVHAEGKPDPLAIPVAPAPWAIDLP